MDGLSTAASVIAVMQLAAAVAKVCGKYLLEVKNAKKDIEEIKAQSEAVAKLLNRTSKLLEGPHKEKLDTSQDFIASLSDCESELKALQQKLEEDFTTQALKKRNRLFSRFGAKDFKWPFSKIEIDRVVGQLEKLQQSIDRSLQIDQTRIILSVEQEVNLAKLVVADGATFGSFHDEYEPECLPGTRMELLEDINKWIADSSGKHIFWLCGMAGTGKSTISRTVARTLQDNGQLGASFFFKRGKAYRGDASRFFGTLAQDLRKHIPQLGPEMSEVVKNEPNISGRVLREQFEKLILGPLSKLDPAALSGSKATAVIVIDALDECEGENDVRQILALLARLKALNINSRIFITSRPEICIQLGFKKLSEEDHTDLILHEIQKLTINRDISAYLVHEFAMIQQERRIKGTWPGSDTIQVLTEIATPLFICAATMCRFIADRKFPATERLDAVLQFKNTKFASKFAATYLPLFHQSLVDTDDTEKQIIISRFQDVVGTIVLLESPLSCAALSRITGRPEDEIQCGLEPFQSVIDIPEDPNDPIQTFHLSFRDFILDDRNKQRWFWIDAKQAHRAIAKRCIQVMSETLRKDICDLKIPGTLLSEIDSAVVERGIPSDLRYACQYWVHHHRMGDSYTSSEQMQGVNTFLRHHLLYWLEAMSLLRLSSQLLYLLRDLNELIAQNDTSNLSETIYDAKRFIQFNQQILEKAPLQLYASALLFVPEGSLTRSLFFGDLQFSFETASQSSWSTLMQTLEGHTYRVNSVAFSPNNRLLVSASDDKTIKLWDITSGAILQTLVGHALSVSCVTFSPDSRRLASGSQDRTVKLWDAVSGSMLQNLNGHSRPVKSIAFSSHDRWLASASTDKTIKLWDSLSGALLRTLESHNGQVRSVEFSPDDKQLVSGSDDGIIKLWDPVSGCLLQTLNGHNKAVYSTTFSPNGRYLASASADTTIKLWEPISGSLLHILCGHTKTVAFIAFSPDSNQLVSTSYGDSVKLWDTTSRTPLLSQTLSGIVNISSAAISPDGKQLASISFSESINLWDIASAETQKPQTEEHSDSVTAVVFSPDGKRLASGSGDKTIKLWDTASTKPLLLRTLKDHSNFIMALAFSPDGRHLASAAFDKEIIMWDAIFGNRLDNLTCNDLTTHIIFSPNGKYVRASTAYGNESFFAWNALTGKLSQMQQDGVDKLVHWEERLPLKIDSKPLSSPPPIPGVLLSPKPLITVEEMWLCCNGIRVLWLPHQYRPNWTSLTTSGDLVAIGCESGLVYTIRIPSSLY
ncbi:hypothetical protein ABW19_dt0209518 [Dactylella cylindrospora]|nr:hypothetical protein ABW19_dt0209518 [Dactylella cylindrospora]